MKELFIVLDSKAPHPDAAIINVYENEADADNFVKDEKELGYDFFVQTYKLN